MVAFLLAVAMSSRSAPIQETFDVPPKLRSQALRFVALAKKKDLMGLSKLCIGSVECFEVFRLTPVEMRFDKDSFFRVPLDERHNHFGYQARREVVHLRSLDSLHRKFGRYYCGLIVDTDRMPDWIHIEKDDPELDDLIPFPGIGLSGKIASNAIWRVDFELRHGNWLATRFIFAER